MPTPRNKYEREVSFIHKLGESQQENSTELQVKKQEHALIKDIVKKFISQQNLLIYGGYALNSLLPSKERFYSEDELNDFDILSPNAKEHAKLLADSLYDHGFIYTEVKPAVHDGTFKIFVNFEGVADITQVSEAFFFEMLKLSQKERHRHKHLKENLPPISISPIFLLKYFIITEFTRPQSSLFRWEKVYTRLSSIYKHYGFAFSHSNYSRSLRSIHETSLPEVKSILHKTLDIVMVHKLPLVGNYAMGIYLGKNFKIPDTFLFECCKLDQYFSVFEILAVDPDKTLITIKHHLETILPPTYRLSTDIRDYTGDILPRHTILVLEVPDLLKINLLTIINAADHCYATVEKNGIVLGTPYTILHFLYGYWLLYYVYENRRIVYLIHQLIKRWEQYIFQESPMEERFVSTCYGNEKSSINVKKEHFHNASKKYIYKPVDRFNLLAAAKTLKTTRIFKKKGKSTT